MTLTLNYGTRDDPGNRSLGIGVNTPNPRGSFEMAIENLDTTAITANLYNGTLCLEGPQAVLENVAKLFAAEGVSVQNHVDKSKLPKFGTPSQYLPAEEGEKSAADVKDEKSTARGKLPRFGTPDQYLKEDAE